MTSEQIRQQLITERDNTRSLVEQLQEQMRQLDNAITALSVGAPAEQPKKRGRPRKLEAV